MNTQLRRLSGSSGQSLIEFSIVMPFLLLIVLGVVEVGSALLDEHVVTRLAREAANLISRDTTIQTAADVMADMNSRPVNFSSGSKLILSVIKRGATVGTANYDRLVLYQRGEFGSFSGSAVSAIQISGSFSGSPPDYIAPNSDSNTSLRVTSVPANLVNVKGGMVYVAEIFTTRPRITPLNNFGVVVKDTLYSIAYF